MTFEVNDTVKCINEKPLSGNDVAPKLTVGTEYQVKEIHTCECGSKHIGLGLPLDYNWVKCYECKEELPITTHWCHPSRFTK